MLHAYDTEADLWIDLTAPDTPDASFLSTRSEDKGRPAFAMEAVGTKLYLFGGVIRQDEGELVRAAS